MLGTDLVGNLSPAARLALVGDAWGPQTEISASLEEVTRVGTAAFAPSFLHSFIIGRTSRPELEAWGMGDHSGGEKEWWLRGGGGGGVEAGFSFL